MNNNNEQHPFAELPGLSLETNAALRHKFALMTCDGCHNVNETNTVFQMLSPRGPSTTSFLSPFLTGTTITDPYTGLPRTFNELERRRALLRNAVCP